MKFSVLIMVSGLLLGSLSAMAAGPKGALRVPVAGDSGSTLQQINLLREAKGLQALPAYLHLTSDMSAAEIQKLKNTIDDQISQVIQYEILETSSVYGNSVDGRKACFLGSNKAMIQIYEKMIDSFLSEQFGVLAISTKQPNHFGIKFDESDSGTSGTWINIYKCKD